MSMETIVVEKNGKFGPMVEGKYYSFSKFYKGPKTFAEGQSLTVDVYTAASGKKYINSLDGDVSVAPKIVAPVFNNTPVAKYSGGLAAVGKPVSATMSKAEWANKDRNQMIGGRSHDAAQLVLAAVTASLPLEEVLKMYKEALEGVLKLAEEVK